MPLGRWKGMGTWRANRKLGVSSPLPTVTRLGGGTKPRARQSWPRWAVAHPASLSVYTPLALHGYPAAVLRRGSC